MGAFLSAWSSGRQADAKIAADHAAWLRDKRAEVYVQMHEFLRAASWRRVQIVQDGVVKPDFPTVIAEALKPFSSSEIVKLGGVGSTFLSQDVAQAFNQAAIANVRALQLFCAAVGQATSNGAAAVSITLSEDIRQAMEWASKAEQEVSRLIRLDVSWTDYNRKYLRAQRRAQRRQNKKSRDLEQRRTAELAEWGLYTVAKVPTQNNNNDSGSAESMAQRTDAE